MKRADEDFADREQLISDATALIEKLMHEYFDIVPDEKALIDDTVSIMIPSVRPSRWGFRRSRTQFRDRPETVQLHSGTGVHLHPGILFEIMPEHRSESSRNRVHLAPDSPVKDAPRCPDCRPK